MDVFQVSPLDSRRFPRQLGLLPVLFFVALVLGGVHGQGLPEVPVPPSRSLFVVSDQGRSERVMHFRLSIPSRAVARALPAEPLSLPSRRTGDRTASSPAAVPARSMPTAVPQVLAAPLPTAQAVAELAPTLAPQTPASYHAVPALRQRPGSYECGPTSVSMVLAYYHALNSDLPALTPGEIIRDLGARFNPKRGIAPDKLVAALQEMNLGYRTVEWSSGLDQQALLDELHQGPVIALVRSRLSRNGYPHLLVVTGMAADGSSVQLNDPLTGGGRLVSWETFEGAWSFEEYPAAFHVIVRLRP